MNLPEHQSQFMVVR